MGWRVLILTHTLNPTLSGPLRSGPLPRVSSLHSMSAVLQCSFTPPQGISHICMALCSLQGALVDQVQFHSDPGAFSLSLQRKGIGWGWALGYSCLSGPLGHPNPISVSPCYSASDTASCWCALSPTCPRKYSAWFQTGPWLLEAGPSPSCSALDPALC